MVIGLIQVIHLLSSLFSLTLSPLRYADGKSRQAHFRFGGVVKWLSEAETGSLEIVSKLKNLRYAFTAVLVLVY